MDPFLIYPFIAYLKKHAHTLSLLQQQQQTQSTNI
jgi:hypothetical protein